MKIIRDIKELTPRMQEKVTAFMADCHSQGVECYLFETYRSQERQNELYAQGRTVNGRKVTWTLNSRHKGREAVDMAFGGEGKWHWNGDWDRMIDIAKNYGLESLAPREKAHLQDDGTEFNTNEMGKHMKTQMEIEVPKELHIFNSYDDESPCTMGEMKALINIGLNRWEKRMAEESIKDLTK
jgi:hypothetical protein